MLQNKFKNPKTFLIIVILMLQCILFCACADKGDNSPADGEYLVDVAMSGGTGKAYINSPATLMVKDGSMYLTAVWSSSNYDYMIVDGTKYLDESDGGKSTFTIPISTLGKPVTVIGDTTAMSVPHEIEYEIVLTLGGDSAQSQSASGSSSHSDKIVHDFDDWEAVKLDYATQFSIRKSEGYSFITIGEDGKSIQNILLVDEGYEVFDTVPDNVIIISKPVSDAYLVSTSAMDLICAIDALKQIHLSGTKTEDWYISEASKAMEEGQLLYAGKYSAPDYELILSSGCDLAIENTMIYHNPEVKEKLEEIGVPVIVERSSYEKHPLGRLEWIKFYGEVFGKEADAETFYEEQRSEIEAISETKKDEKTIAFFSVNSLGQIIVRKSGDYVTQMIELAGGKYVPFEMSGGDEGQTSTIKLQMEEFYYEAKHADILIYNSAIEDEITDIDDLILKNELFADFDAIKSGSVYCTGKNLFQQITGMGAFMEDLQNIITQKDDNLNYLKKID